MAQDIVPLGPDKVGRPSKYDPLFAEQARKLCLLGATDEELAVFFDVCTATIYNWQNEHSEFLEAIRAGKIKADAEVADSLYRRATGEHVQLEKIVKTDAGFEAVRYKSYIPGDPVAAYKWLLNRRRQDWTDSKAVELSGRLTVDRVERVIVDPANTHG
jgi:hypothetical protein